jgi:cytochrome d ubiquinol oxidase subunit II
MSTGIAVTLFAGVVAYAILAGGDFGAGFWDLTAGRNGAAREEIDRNLAPVWEANHTWLIYCLVLLWTAFPTAFAAIMSTVYIPLGLAALGIVVRGSGFAFREFAIRTPQQRAAGSAFAISSVVTPFFLGAAGGAIASGRIPAAGNGDSIGSWVTPTSILTGALAVVACAQLAAVELTVAARRHGDARLETWFRRRAVVSAAATAVLAVAGAGIFRRDASRMGDRLVAGPGLPFLIVAVLSAGAALVLLRTAPPRLVRALGIVAAGSIVIGWGVAQYPYLLGTHLTIAEAAAPDATLIALAVVAVAAAVLVTPSLVLLYRLQQRGQLE